MEATVATNVSEWNGSHWSFWRYAGLFARVVLTAATCFLNAGACFVIMYGKRWKQAKGIFLLSLTVNDLLLSLTVMPVQISAYVMAPDIADTFFCTIIFLRYAQPNSLLCLTVLCLDRLLAVLSPYWYLAHVGRRQAGCVVVGQWLLTLLQLLWISRSGSSQIYRPDFLTCSSLRPGGTVQVGYYIINYLIIGLSSSYVYYIASSQRRRMRAQDRISGAKPNRADSAIVEEFKAILYLVLVNFTSAIAGFLRSMPPGTGDWVKPALPWIIYSNAIINTIIYSYKTEWFRETLHKILNKVRNKCRKQVTSVVHPAYEGNNDIQGTNPAEVF